MTNGLSLTQMALELLQINENFCHHVQYPAKSQVSDFELYTFTQMWGSTATGFGGFGGSAMTTERTYVFVPTVNDKEKCLVFFGGRFAYSVPYSQTFIEDVFNGHVEGVSGKGKYLKNEDKAKTQFRR